jgi:hypothetical protein
MIAPRKPGRAPAARENAYYGFLMPTRFIRSDATPDHRAVLPLALDDSSLKKRLVALFASLAASGTK